MDRPGDMRNELMVNSLEVSIPAEADCRPLAVCVDSPVCDITNNHVDGSVMLHPDPLFSDSTPTKYDFLENHICTIHCVKENGDYVEEAKGCGNTSLVMEEKVHFLCNSLEMSDGFLDTDSKDVECEPKYGDVNSLLMAIDEMAGRVKTMDTVDVLKELSAGHVHVFNTPRADNTMKGKLASAASSLGLDLSRHVGIHSLDDGYSGLIGESSSRLDSTRNHTVMRDLCSDPTLIQDPSWVKKALRIPDASETFWTDSLPIFNRFEPLAVLPVSDAIDCDLGMRNSVNSMEAISSKSADFMNLNMLREEQASFEVVNVEVQRHTCLFHAGPSISSQHATNTGHQEEGNIFFQTLDDADSNKGDILPVQSSLNSTLDIVPCTRKDNPSKYSPLYSTLDDVVGTKNCELTRSKEGQCSQICEDNLFMKEAFEVQGNSTSGHSDRKYNDNFGVHLVIDSHLRSPLKEGRQEDGSNGDRHGVALETQSEGPSKRGRRGKKRFDLDCTVRRSARLSSLRAPHSVDPYGGASLDSSAKASTKKSGTGTESSLALDRSNSSTQSIP